MFTEYDLDHHRLQVRMLVLEQLVLKLFLMISKNLSEGDPESTRGVCRALVRKGAASLKETPLFYQLAPAEQAMFLDESSEIFSEITEHLEFILSGDL
jgi:hypothetical protein